MTDTHTLKKIERKIAFVESEGHGEVVVKIKNGAVYLVDKTDSEYFEKKKLDKKQ